MTSIKYCLICNSSLTAAWDGEKAYRNRICPDCDKKGHTKQCPYGCGMTHVIDHD